MITWSQLRQMMRDNYDPQMVVQELERVSRNA